MENKETKKRKLPETKLEELPTKKKDRLKNKHYLFKSKEVIWDGNILRCCHNRRQTYCTECQGIGVCVHKKRRQRCKICKLDPICYHNKQRSHCHECLYDQHRQKCTDCLKNKICHQWKILRDFPELLNLFDEKRNNMKKLEAHFIRMGSQKEYYWLCPESNCLNRCEHSWLASPNNLRNVINGKTKNGCPYCSLPAKKICICNSILSLCPDLIKNWDYEKNLDVDPGTISISSGQQINWICHQSLCQKNCRHSWIAPVYSMTDSQGKQSTGCPYCCQPPKKCCECNSLASKFPKILKEWDYKTNVDLDPRSILPGSSQEVWWLCTKTNCIKNCPHRWFARICNRTINRTGCPYCTQKLHCPCNSLYGKYRELVNTNWNYQKNVDLDPRNLAPFSGQYVWWQCLLTNCSRKCKHPDWFSPISSLTSGHKCGFCSGKKLCKCKTIRHKHPDIVSKFWDYEKNNALHIFPENTAPYSDNGIWWFCKEVTCAAGCAHSWNARPGDLITENRQRTGCPFCCKPAQRFCHCNSLYGKFKDLIDNSWDFKKNILDPNTLGPNSNHKVWWYCDQKHEWEDHISHRTDPDRKSRCRQCYHELSSMECTMKSVLTELKVLGIVEWFKTPEDHTTFHGMVWKKNLILDFLVKFKYLKHEVVIETDGEQHFNWRRHINLKNWEASLQRDFAKNLFLRESHRHLFRISHKVKITNYKRELEIFTVAAQESEKNSNTAVYHKFIDEISYNKQKQDFMNIKLRNNPLH